MAMFDDYMFDRELNEQDSFFDDRTWKSNVLDIYGGDNFADFCEEFFEMLDENDYWES
jgi:hypothetical protein